ncbi:unnamed protein product [Linum trigynum]|uniref:Uncharacterized protein n=1 Tax=Linum trigynum TaxID=586398 RepID=A0AAV2F7X4_9ROSI
MGLQLQGAHCVPSMVTPVYRHSSPRRPLGIPSLCLACSVKPSSDHLRSQLHQLRSEANAARDDANSARLRMMRLSEAAENLKRQAAVSVQTGRENDARQLLFQKKKVMQAIDRSKGRIELLDELCAKLNEAISKKETQLIGNLASDLEVDGEDASGPVRVVSPKAAEGFPNGLDDAKDLSSNSMDISHMHKPQSCGNGNFKLEYLDVGISNENLENTGLSGISSYYDFLEHIDTQLSKIEAQLVTVLNVSAWILIKEKTPDNSEVKQTEELLSSIRVIRQQVAEMMEGKVEI